MHFLIDGKQTTTALAKLQRLVGRDVEHLTLETTDAGDALHIHAHALQRRAVIRVPAQSRKVGRVNIEWSKFAGICKNRGKLDFIIDKSLAFKQIGANYAGQDIAVLPPSGDLLTSLSKASLLPHIQAQLLFAMKACLITSVFGGQQLALTLRLRENYLQVAVADSYHAALAKIHLSGKDHKYLRQNGWRQPLELPMQYAEILTGQFQQDGLIIHIGRRRITFANQEVQVELPALQAGVNMVAQARQLEKQLNGQALTVLDANRLRAAMDNLKILGQRDHPLLWQLRPAEKSIQLIYQAPGGRMQDSLPLAAAPAKKYRLRLEPDNLYDIANKLPTKVELRYNRHIIRLTGQPREGISVDYYSSQLQKKAR